MSDPQTQPEPLSATAVSEIAGSGEVELIDVRQADEFEAGHIAGARHIELGELPSRAAEINRDQKVVFYCRSGTRSAMATDAFAEAGYDVHNMTGGLISWVESQLPLEPADGEVAEPRPPS
jgi:rhodanese-related sulfurtransferase